MSFFVMSFVLLFAVLGFIFVTFDLSGLSFVFGLAILLAFMFFLAFAMFFMYSDKQGSYGVIGGVLILMVLNVLVIFILTGRFGLSHITTLFFSILGMMIVLANVVSQRKGSPQVQKAAPEEGEKYYYPYSDKIEPVEATGAVKVKMAEMPASVEKTFVPGKYVASRKANKFHIAKCDWAARISRENQVWFNSREDAQARGFEADRCVF